MRNAGRCLQITRAKYARERTHFGSLALLWARSDRNCHHVSSYMGHFGVRLAGHARYDQGLSDAGTAPTTMMGARKQEHDAVH